jgi:hypothetical protein
MHWIALQTPPDIQAGQANQATTLTDPLTALGWWALQFTPKVALLPDAVLLEVSASERLWGGRAALLRRIYMETKPVALIRYARAATSLVALGRLYAAQPARTPADDLPLTALAAARLHLATLMRLGCSNWGQLRRLPRDGLARRFGAALLDALDQAYGERPDIYPWLTLPDVFEARLELPSQIDNAPALLFGARRLLAQLQVWLQMRQQGVLAIELGWHMDARRNTDKTGALSRAQMSMLPRLKPRCFYDLVVEVAIVRPGPIQGGMVHPYLLARKHPEQVRYASPALEEVLKRTLGVPIFQEQVMQIAMAAADFSPGEADELRRSMAAWKRKGGVHKFHDRLVGGMLKNGYSAEFADNLFHQIEGFGEYGFPESHAASFALLVWVSCWLKRHEPASFLAAMINSQPMGFYGPSQLVQDARRHGVTVLPADVSDSDWDCTLLEKLGSESDYFAAQTAQQPCESGATATTPAVRLGLRLISGLSEAAAQRIGQARAQQVFSSVDDLARRAALDAGELNALASADALHSLAGHRRQQVWQASALKTPPLLLRDAPVNESACLFSAAPEAQEVRFDYASLGLTLRSHPLSLLRKQLSKLKLSTADKLHTLPHGRRAATVGLVTMRQSPGTARGVTFVTLEDETGHTNVIVWKALKDKQRSELLHAQLLAVHGTWQRDEDSGGQVCHLIARRLQDLTLLLGELATHSRDFH